MEKLALNELTLTANRIRRDIIKMLTYAGSGHPGGSLSATEIMTALYFNEMNHDPSRPDNPARDRFILSKGHVAPVLYAVLARSGYYPIDEMKTLRKLGTRLQGHPGKCSGLPGIEVSSGSLGQGLSVGVGLGISFKYLDKTPQRVYVLMGDGEVQEGSVWEAFMSAGHYKLDNLTAFIDKNRLQIDGKVKDVMDIDPLDEKIKAFGWRAITCAGNDMQSVLNAIDEAKVAAGQPCAIIAETVKGKGVSFMEDNAGWHGKAPNAEQGQKATDELLAQFEELKAKFPKDYETLCAKYDVLTDF